MLRDQSQSVFGPRLADHRDLPNLLSAFLPPLEIRDKPLGSLLELNATSSLT